MNADLPETGVITLEVSGDLTTKLAVAKNERQLVTLVLDNMAVSQWIKHYTREPFQSRSQMHEVVTLKQVHLVGKKETVTVQDTVKSEPSINDLQKAAYLRILKDPTSAMEDIDHAAEGLRFMETSDKTAAEKAEKAEKISPPCCTAGCKCYGGVDPSFRQYFVDQFDKHYVQRPAGVISLQEERAIFAGRGPR